MQALKISIPKPCHENWQTMTPEVQGRFCDKCCKTVIDFSTKAETEIRQLIDEHPTNKICGRFRNDQLENPVKVNIQIATFRNKLVPLHAFALSVLLAFGTTLFSCTTPEDRKIGKIEVSLNDTLEKADSSKRECYTLGEMSLPVQQVVYSEEDGTTKGDTVFNNVDTNVIDTVDLKTAEVTVDASHLNLNDKYITMGGLSFSHIIYNVPAIDDSEFVTQIQIDSIANQESSISVFPNPTLGIVNLKLNLIEDCNLQVDLYDMSGRLIRNIIPFQSMQAELRDMQLNISEQPAGIYLLRVIAGEKIFNERMILTK
ncbi:MAG: T9SS type A sorting domain-containing protein [Bacteroidia bacterium]